MNAFVKDFIENNIGFIEIKDYRSFFDRFLRDLPNDECITAYMDLRHALVDCGIWEETKQARTYVILEAVDAIVLLAIAKGYDSIDLDTIESQLKVILGIGRSTIFQHLEQDYEYDPYTKRFKLV